MVVKFVTAKRDREIALAEISRTPKERRIGPMLIDELSGLPYVEKDYGSAGGP